MIIKFIQIITLSITGALNAILSEEHKREMCRYLYNHQACVACFLWLVLLELELLIFVAEMLIL